MPHSSNTGRYAALLKHRPADDAEVLAAGAAVAEDKIAEYVRRVVDSAPPLPDAARARLASLILQSDRSAQ